ncbi:alpha/beta fold hydrolase [Robbsia sp. Bb-Pol-6]|uniref:Proline iminopeptidase n=1 Tax=Robbsia betulipollinis TaxID=2981849 RepID=A0ABT3ZSG3_9BURK|nr:alpha/beta fold hydrolase [Robbsia betulipollinis]MCY0389222.1 alpha/beta fold hydrolase [Robbsia betulipollinis]
MTDTLPPHFEDGLLDVGDGHALYWRAHGDPAAPVMLVVHGGPGGAHNPSWGKFFDPAQWRVVFFDQRGCGRSTPFGKTACNTLNDLVGDIEKLRTALGVERWALFGGSWGTTLALAYGIAHPQRCTGFLLRGIFLARQQDIDWFIWDVRRIFPEAHAAFLDAIERASGSRPRDRDEVLALAAAPLARYDAAGIALARAWSGFEAKLSSVQPMPAAPVVLAAGAAPGDVAAPPGVAAPSTPAATAPAGTAGTPAGGAAVPPDPLEGQRRAVSMALLEHHYMAHELPAPDFLGRLSALQDHPCHIVHGRFDMVCPAEQALSLARAWPGATVKIVDAAGHWTFEPGIEKALFAASAALRDTLQKA